MLRKQRSLGFAVSPIEPDIWLVIDGVHALFRRFRLEPQESHLTTARIGAFGVSERNSQYADVTDDVRHLQSLDEDRPAFRSHREAIIEKALPIADHIARRFSNRGEPFDDLVQAARVGLLNAVNRFDVETGSDFLSFAVPTMMGEVRRHFRDHGWAVKVPRRLKDLQKQLVHARGELPNDWVAHRRRRSSRITSISIVNWSSRD